MFKCSVQGEAECVARSPLIWKYWSDTSLWPEWDSEIEWGKIDGPFATGSKGEMKPRNWFLIRFSLIGVEKEKRFATQSYFLFTRVEFHHMMIPLAPSKIKLVHRGELTGFLAPLLYLFLGWKMKKALQNAVDNLSKIVEKAPF